MTKDVGSKVETPQCIGKMKKTRKEIGILIQAREFWYNNMILGVHFDTCQYHYINKREQTNQYIVSSEC